MALWDGPYEVDLSNNITIHVDGNAFGATATIAGGYSDHGALGWAYVIADRLQRHDIEVRVQATNGQAIMTVNGRNKMQVFHDCVMEVA